MQAYFINFSIFTKIIETAKIATRANWLSTLTCSYLIYLGKAEQCGVIPLLGKILLQNFNAGHSDRETSVYI